ncbi:hypothetical protein EZJ19_07765 [Parasulfuritortus cantonensis]|uniref:Uncharacterized protein n=1 Tax=Parasulfuritortus cantonensis TaxID=2528202 RepID=A0A4R1BDT0_9PROT|nr:hypothetical protein [Parasulfuritortus cantonensis]TCJ15197.1 hypothetical protein EZJ19_07765 [Parasulfuritortus cantonensis]
MMMRFLLMLFSSTGILILGAWAMASTLQEKDPMPEGTFSAVLAQDGIWMLGLACLAVGLLIQLTWRIPFKLDGD